MFIHIWAGGMPFNSDTIADGKSLGGSETAADCMARELAKLGHKVTMFTSSKERGQRKVENLVYEWHGDPTEEFPLGDRYHFVARVPHDVAIVQRHPLAFSRWTNAKVRVLWMHDLALKRNGQALVESIPNLDYIFGVSEWHRRQIIDTYKLPERNVIATSNGVDEELFPPLLTREAREPRSLIYTARPERGLEYLVKPGGIMERLRDVKLYVCGYDNTTPPMEAYYNMLWQRCDALPNVVNLGPLGKADLYKKMASVMLHVYPTVFEDTSCIALMEAQYCGTPFISSQVAALPETGLGAGVKLLPLQAGDTKGDRTVNEPLFAATVQRVLGDAAEWNALHEKALAYKRPWSSVAARWTAIFAGRLAEQSSSPRRLKKHLDRMSDIIAMEQAGMELPEDYAFLKDGKFREHHDQGTDAEEAAGEKVGPHPLNGNARFEATAMKLSVLLKDKKDATVLDYGCAYGHYTMNLRERFTAVSKWVGVDFSARHIEVAKKWAADTQAGNVAFHLGSIPGNLTAIETEKFDVVMANEVIEHVADPRALVESLKQFVAPGGYLLISTPYGPWEDNPKRQGLREHLHHLERGDLEELFGKQPEYTLMAVPFSHETGNYITTFGGGGPEVGHINYERHLVQQAPEETVSLCMIVKNEEQNIMRCLEKVKGLVDEIIIGVDETTTDRTREICQRYGAHTFTIPSPLTIGFDAARNMTLDYADCDWILWLDADEVLENAESLRRYLRHSPADGIAIAQHHLGVNPPGVQKTDYPCRMFRNGMGVKFFGVVHEHPEKELNEGLGLVLAANGTAIAHYGYSTEAIRRERFARNFKLMQRDREEHPARRLGKMLWVRDLSHVVRYEVEKSNGRGPSRQAMQAANECVQMFRELLKDRHDYIVRMVNDALPYYSDAVQFLTGGGGIQFSLNMGIAELGDLKPAGASPVYFFANKKDIEDYTALMLEKATEGVGQKYL